MKLSSINRLIVEGYGRTVDSTYHGKQVTDPRPNVLVLGNWVNHKGTKLLCGVNLNYLDEEQILRLRTNLSSILSDRNLRRRVREIRRSMPDIFNRSYRTYNSDAVNIIKPGTLKFFKPKVDGDELDGDEQAVKGGETQQPVQPMPIQQPKQVKAKPTGPDFSGLETDDDTPEMGTPGGVAQSVKSRHDGMRGDTAKKAQKEVDKADTVRRGEIKGELKDKLEKEIEDKDIEKIGTDDIDSAFEDGEEEQDDGPQNK